jgi:hypothetical protein
MKLPAIIISDPHFTAKPEDEYRWWLWPWLAEELVAEKAKTLLILGDLTDAKDYHPSELVNRLTAAIASMPVEEIIILAGNHDWLKQGGVFFKFLERIQKPRIRVITEITEDAGTSESDPLCLFLPYSKAPARDWKDRDFSHYDYLFMHQTAPGSVASNGQEMEGDEMPPLNAGKVYSGDIHVPQGDRPEYVGSPYHVHFGDNFKPRCIVLDRNRKAFDLHFPTISRRAITISRVEDLGRAGIKTGDQVKITMQLDQADAHHWNAFRREIAEGVRAIGAHLHGLKLALVKSNQELVRGKPTRSAPRPEDSIFNFVSTHELGGDLLDAGLDLLEE